MARELGGADRVHVLPLDVTGPPEILQEAVSKANNAFPERRLEVCYL